MIAAFFECKAKAIGSDYAATMEQSSIANLNPAVEHHAGMKISSATDDYPVADGRVRTDVAAITDNRLFTNICKRTDKNLVADFCGTRDNGRGVEFGAHGGSRIKMRKQPGESSAWILYSDQRPGTVSSELASHQQAPGSRVNRCRCRFLVSDEAYLRRTGFIYRVCSGNQLSMIGTDFTLTKISNGGYD